MPLEFGFGEDVASAETFNSESYLRQPIDIVRAVDTNVVFLAKSSQALCGVGDRRVLNSRILAHGHI